MSANCPHCSKEIDTLSGFVPEATLRDRLKAKDGEISAFSARIKDLEPKALQHDVVARERDVARAELSAHATRAERVAALAARGLGSEVLEGVTVLWESAQAARPEAERAAFGAWFDAADGAAVHPLLAGLFAAPDRTAAPDSVAAGKPAAKPAAGLPRPAGPTSTPASPQQGRLSPDQVRAYFQSPEYRALKPEDKRAKQSELQAAANTRTGLT